MLVAQLDYIYFFYGLVLILLGAVCLSMERSGPLPTPWWLLGAFALTHGASEWLILLAMTAGDSPTFGTIRTVVVGASFLLLLEFARRTHRVVHGSTLGPWLYAGLGGILSGLALAFGPAHLGTVIRLVLAVPAVFWTTGLFLNVAARNQALGGGPDSRRARRWGAFYFGVYGVTAGVVVPRAPFLPGPWPTDELLLSVTGIPIQLVRALVVCGMALSVWALAISFDSRGSVFRKKRFLFWSMASTIVVMLAGGWLFTDRLGRLHEKDTIDEVETLASQIYGQLANQMQDANGGAKTLAGLLARFHVAETGIEPSRLDEVVDAFAIASDGWVVYVVDPAGLTISSSNRGQPDSFQGKNFATRPYIKASMEGRPGRFLGVGIVSGIPGFYASEPVRGAGGRVMAVAVVKRNLTREELGEPGVAAAFLVTAEGRTILSNRDRQERLPLWRPGSSDTHSAAAHSPPRSTDPGESAPVLLDHAIVGTEWVTIGGRKVIAVRRPLPGADWSLVVLKREKTQVANRLLGIIITLLLCAVVLTYFVAMQRQYGTEAHIAGKRREAEGRAREFARQADTDALTGLLNRLGFNGAFSREFERAGRHGQPLSVVMLDLDHFKRVNDEHGHAAGDQVLIGVARLLEANVRDSDVVARWGGEEFVVVATMTPGTGAVRLAEKLRAKLAATTLGPSGAVTGSFGVTELRPGDSIEGLLHRADEALYRAKNGGRNRVESAGATGATGGGATGAADGGATGQADGGATGAGPEHAPPASASRYADTGFAPIDRDHVTLSAALEKFVETVAAGDEAAVQRELASMITGAAAHFSHEERLMQEFAYPLHQRHAEIHALFLDDAHRFLEELKRDGMTVSFRRWVMGRLLEWFRLHVLTHDLELGCFLLDVGAAQGAASAAKG